MRKKLTQHGSRFCLGLSCVTTLATDNHGHEPIALFFDTFMVYVKHYLIHGASKV